MGLHEDPNYISPRERIRRFKVKSRQLAQKELKTLNKVIKSLFMLLKLEVMKLKDVRSSYDVDRWEN